jgi:hypothetical protein
MVLIKIRVLINYQQATPSFLIPIITQILTRLTRWLMVDG